MALRCKPLTVLPANQSAKVASPVGDAFQEILAGNRRLRLFAGRIVELRRIGQHGIHLSAG